jgi:hypothetical protein
MGRGQIAILVKIGGQNENIIFRCGRCAKFQFME